MRKVLVGLVTSGLIAGSAVGLLLFGWLGLMITLPLALATSIFVGAPAYFLLRRLGWLSWWQLTMAGSALVWPLAASGLPKWELAAAVTLTGAAAGFLFWLIGHRPNNSFKPNSLRESA